MNRFVMWLFATPANNRSAGVIWWWELRRIPFNIIVGLYGLVCLIIFFIAIEASGHLEPGEDAVEPIALLFAPIAINVLYTLGWLVEVPTRMIAPNLSPSFGPTLLKLGLGIGLALISFPPAFWIVNLLIGVAYSLF